MDPLRHDLSRRQMRMIGIGGAIGTGLFLGSAAAIATAGPAVVVSFLIGGAVALTLAYALSTMVAAYPGVHGFGGLAHRFLGRGPAFVQRWWYWGAQVVNVGSEALAAGIYVRLWWPQLPLWVPVAVIAIVVLAANALTVRVFGEFEYWFAMIKVVAILLFIGLGVAAIFFGLPGSPAIGLSGWTDHGGFAPFGLPGIWLAMVLVFFSYMGTESMAIAAGEARDARRDVVAATRGVVVRLLLFYVLATAVVISVVPWTDAGGTVTASPFVRLFQYAGIPAAVHIMNAVVLVAAVSAMNTNVYLTSRTLYQLSVTRHAPGVFARVNRRGVPLNALLFSGLGLVLASLLAAFAPGQAFLALVGLALGGAVLTWVLILATYLAFWRAHPERRSPRGNLLAAGSALSILVLLGVLATMSVTETFATPTRLGAPLLLLVVVAAVAHRLLGRRAGAEPGPEEPAPDPAPAGPAR
ncbi:amino acid permease [Nonomuraea sp. FMUSA5-5]|uniref:Amino acid permease n=1 Tax=Nonomuraea composti TaxID=2720023 RepID=A0ABX1AY14_9ACTN|nr:amino acid permease [Nonomuraea sp. FMUSA5-5]NJP89876.1 amino acid permease [Nonomuraea sp. FMUSA5-5]